MNGNAQYFGHLVAQRKKAQAGIPGKAGQQIDIAATPGITPGGGSKDFQPDDSILTAKSGE
jgi:hypothetical protein